MTNKLSFYNNLEYNSWNVIQKYIEDDIPKCEINIGFTNKFNTKPVTFNNLKYGCEFIDLQTGDVFAKNNFPKGPEILVETDLEFIFTFDVNLKFGGKYSVKVWSENSNILSEKIFPIEIPMCKKPHNSWIWDESLNSWKAPIEYPKDGLLYSWDETSNKWIIDINSPIVGPFSINPHNKNWEAAPTYNIE